MSLINKMLQDLDKRHAADGGGKTLTQQLRPVRARKNWQRIIWEVIIGLAIGVGWALWVMNQISPRSVVTELAFQSQSKRPLAIAPAVQPPAAPAVAAPAATVPAQAAAPQGLPVSAPAAVPAARSAEEVNFDLLKLATEIATPFNEKGVGAKPRAERKPAAEAAPGAKPGPREKPASATVAGSVPAPAKSVAGLSPSRAHDTASIDKQPRVSTPAERAENEFRKATALLNQGRVAEAIDGYRSTLQQDGKHVAARQALVGLLLENRRIDEAQQLLQEGLRLAPDRPDYAILLARIQVERGDVQGAHDLLSKHAGGAANNADYHAFDAALLQRLGRHKEAVSEYEAALRLAPGAGVWWMGLGISLQADNRGTEALDAYRRAKSVGGLSPDLLAFVDQRMKQLQ